MMGTAPSPAYGTGLAPFASEAEARAFLLSQAFVQITPPCGRVFMPAFRAGRVQIEPGAEGGWLILQTLHQETQP